MDAMKKLQADFKRMVKGLHGSLDDRGVLLVEEAIILTAMEQAADMICMLADGGGGDGPETEHCGSQ